MKNKSDIAALESVSFAKNYNDYVLNLISKNLDKNDKILDFGAGYGLFTKMLIDCGYDVISVEINEEKEISELFSKINDNPEIPKNFQSLEDFAEKETPKLIEKISDFTPYTKNRARYYKKKVRPLESTKKYFSWIHSSNKTINSIIN